MSLKEQLIMSRATAEVLDAIDAKAKNANSLGDLDKDLAFLLGLDLHSNTKKGDVNG